MITVLKCLKGCHVEDNAELFIAIREDKRGTMGLNYRKVDFGQNQKYFHNRKRPISIKVDYSLLKVFNSRLLGMLKYRIPAFGRELDISKVPATSSTIWYKML